MGPFGACERMHAAAKKVNPPTTLVHTVSQVSNRISGLPHRDDGPKRPPKTKRPPSFSSMLTTRIMSRRPVTGTSSVVRRRQFTAGATPSSVIDGAIRRR